LLYWPNKKTRAGTITTSRKTLHKS
jgi:hypothetical protein